MKGRFFSRKLNELSPVYPLFFTLIFIFILIQYSFTNLDNIFYDFNIQTDLLSGQTEDIVIITLDEESDEFLGDSYPYSYATHHRFIKRLLKDDPLSIVYFISMNEANSEEEDAQIKKFLTLVEGYQSKGGFFNFGTDVDAWGEQVPPNALQPLGYSLGTLKLDASIPTTEFVVREAIVKHQGEDSVHFRVANRYREKNGEQPINYRNLLGLGYERETEAHKVHFRYYTSTLPEKTKVTRIPFHRIVVGNFPSGFFKDKIILVGSQYVSKSDDFILTPYEKEFAHSPKMNIHAQIIHSFIQTKTVFKIPKFYSHILAILVALLLSGVISKVSPMQGLTVIMLSIVAMFFVSTLSFNLFGVWLSITHLILTVFIVYYIWVPFRAMAEYRQRYAIEEEAKLLKKVEHLKQNFISLMSHDLKTPVAKVAGIADLLKNKYKNTDEQQKYIQVIIDATKELNKFISSILDLTKIESQNLTLQSSSKDLNKIVEDVVYGLEFEAKKGKVTLETELAPLYPINIDPELIKRVISNLVENAIKYSGAESTVSVKTWDDEKWVYLEVKDNGIGMDERNAEHVFDKFYRVKNDARYAVKGSGLGLYLAKYFIELHGGKISVESKLGEGTSFKIKLKNA